MVTPDAELVRQALSGRSDAYEQLARRWSARVVAFCHARIGCAHTAEDLAQETLLRGLRGLKSLHNAERFGPWLRGIAHRVCLDWHKSKQTRQVPFSVLDGDGHVADRAARAGDGTSAIAAQQDEIDHLMSLVEQLPEQQREVVMLYYYDDVTYRELAELLEVSVATINARLTDARASLRRSMHCSRNKLPHGK